MGVERGVRNDVDPAVADAHNKHPLVPEVGGGGAVLSAVDDVAGERIQSWDLGLNGSHLCSAGVDNAAVLTSLASRSHTEHSISVGDVGRVTLA